MKFGGAEISRMVLGVNPFYGYAHYNNNFGAVMKEWYTQDKVCDIMHQCNRYGINAFNYVHMDRAPKDWARFQAEGGKMHLIIQVSAGVEASMLVKTLKPLALHRQGEVVDKAFQNGQMNYREGMVQAGARPGCAGRRGHAQAGGDRAGGGRGLGRGFLRRAASTTGRALSEEWKKVLNGETAGDARRDLSAERSAAHVPRDAADHQAVLRVQDPGGRTHPGRRHRPGIPHGIRKHQAHRRHLCRHVPAREGRSAKKTPSESTAF